MLAFFDSFVNCLQNLVNSLIQIIATQKFIGLNPTFIRNVILRLMKIKTNIPNSSTLHIYILVKIPLEMYQFRRISITSLNESLKQKCIPVPTHLQRLCSAAQSRLALAEEKSSAFCNVGKYYYQCHYACVDFLPQDSSP